MIDIHTHILPQVDDGSKSMEESIQMAKIAADCGVSTIVVTPHCNMSGYFQNYYGEKFREEFQILAEEIENNQIPLKIAPGMEVYATEEVPDLLQKGKLVTLNHSRYLLMEFGVREDYALMDFLITELTEQGIQPIIAHPERYPFIQRHPGKVCQWIERGCYLQVNKGSLLGSFGNGARITSRLLLEQNLVSLVASDAHTPLYRNTDLTQVRRLITDTFSKEYAEILMDENPRCIIENKELVSPEKLTITNM